MILILGLSVPLLSQSTTDGAIAGTVMDATGAVIPNAAVVVRNNGTNAEQTVTSDATGYFRVGKLTPAEYTVTITVTGFAPFKADRVIVEIGRISDLSPKLNVGSATEKVVEVTGEAAVVNTASADFAPVVNQTAIANLPINGGRWSNFVLTTPGAVTNADGFGLISFKGQSELLNNNTVDGADNTQAFFSEERGRTRGGYAFPKSAIQEFQVNTSNYTAEYGRATGAVINSVTKSGTNNLHGEMYFYDRDNNWGAINPFTTITTQDSPGVFNQHVYKPKDWRKISGVSVGGPIIKDKLFFNFTFDWYNRNFPGTAVARSPLAFFAAPSSSQVSTLAKQVYGATSPTLDAQALALYNTDMAALITTLGSTPRTGEQFIWLPKLDWQINQKNHFSLTIDRQRWFSPAGMQTQATNTYGRASFGDDGVKVTTGVAKLNSFVTNTIANELRVSYGRDLDFVHPQKNITDFEIANLMHSPLFPGYTTPFSAPVNVSTYSVNGWDIGTYKGLDRPNWPDERRQQYADTLTWAHGKHTLKFGVDYTRVLDDSANLYTQFGSYSYSGTNGVISLFTDMNKVNGCSYSAKDSTGKTVNWNAGCWNSYSQGFGLPGVKFATNEYALFAQDDWRVLPRLTLTLGLRWDYEKMPDPVLPNPAVPQTTKLPNDKNNYGPRVGFAYDVFGNGKTALRGGYGMVYGRIINGGIYSALINTGNPGGQMTYTMYANNLSAMNCVPQFPKVLTTAPNCSGSTSYSFFDSNFQNPQVHQLDLSLEQDIGWNTVVSASYLGSMGRHLVSITDLNIAPATSTLTYKVCGVSGEKCVSGPQPGQPVQATTVTVPLFTSRINNSLGSLYDMFSQANSSYNAMALQVNHRMSKHVQFGSSFTWSHAIDTGTNTRTTGWTYNELLEPNNLNISRGNSNNNVPLRLVFHAVAESPWKVQNKALALLANGWQIAPFYQWQNGLSYSATTSGSANCPTGTPTSICTPGVSGVYGGLNGSSGASYMYGLRNQLHMPNTQNIDLKLSKLFRFRERYSVELSGEAFNLFNHQNITGVNNLAYAVGYCSTTSGCGGGYVGPILTYNTGAFGTVQNANSNFAYSQRQIQLGVRIKF